MRPPDNKGSSCHGELWARRARAKAAVQGSADLKSLLQKDLAVQQHAARVEEEKQLRKKLLEERLRPAERDVQQAQARARPAEHHARISRPSSRRAALSVCVVV